jgi:hypothetical protein
MRMYACKYACTYAGSLSSSAHSNARVHALVNVVQVHCLLRRRAIHGQRHVHAGGVLRKENHSARRAGGIAPVLAHAYMYTYTY